MLIHLLFSAVKAMSFVYYNKICNEKEANVQRFILIESATMHFSMLFIIPIMKYYITSALFRMKSSFFSIFLYLEIEYINKYNFSFNTIYGFIIITKKKRK